MPVASPRFRRRLRARLRRSAELLVSFIARPGGRWRSILLRRGPLARLALAGVTVAVSACVPAGDSGELQPTLSMVAVRGGDVAVQNGIPVPSFGWPDRPQVVLAGAWRVQRETFDSTLSLAPRDRSLGRIEAEAGGRQVPEYDDSAWDTIQVPGSLNLPPDRQETGGWYRRSFSLPTTWAGRTLTLKFGGANYLADIWLNGTWLGYHEGGSTPFAFDVTAAARPGARNVLAVRVDNPPWGTRNDIVPWGLADWWNFGGLIRPVWIEASDPVQVVRADVVPHLDGADVSVVLRNAGTAPADATLRVEVLPAVVTEANLLDPDPHRLVPLGAAPVARNELPPEPLAPNDVVRLDTSFLVADAAVWAPGAPALYVLRVSVLVGGAVVDRVVDTFGLRQVAVDHEAPAVLLNGQPVFLPGAALHDQVLEARPGGSVSGALPTPAQIRDQLTRARSVGVRFVRTGHTPANPAALELADRLGLAVWEEIPLYHYTPLTFDIAMRRGVPQQMLREMALRDMNHPSVLFHGLANESTGDDQRTSALVTLRDVDRAIDGTRLTGQASYGFTPGDAANDPLDVAGFTMYYGVFYGADAAADTGAALDAAHRANPAKPIMVLEFGRWADGPGGPESQRRIFDDTAGAILARRATFLDGYVAAGVWWTLEDYATLRPGIAIEHFGLFGRDGADRPVAERVRAAYGPMAFGLDNEGGSVPGGRSIPTATASSSGELVGYVVYGVAVALAVLGAALAFLVRRGGRSRDRRRARRSPAGRPAAGETVP